MGLEGNWVSVLLQANMVAFVLQFFFKKTSQWWVHHMTLMTLYDAQMPQCSMLVTLIAEFLYCMLFTDVYNVSSM